MNAQEIHDLLTRVRSPVDPPYGRASRDEWVRLQDAMDIRFPPVFIIFIDAVGGFDFPGHLLLASSRGRTNGNDTISFTYASERLSQTWPEWLIPFWSKGNGDYFCLDGRGHQDSPVHYCYHERASAELYSASFDEWLRGLEDFMTESQ